MNIPRFEGSLRPRQADVATVVKKQLKQGERRLHIVAPPGAGKTVLGIYIWSNLARTPAVVLSPNSAIQSQWASKTRMFCDTQDGISSDPKSPGMFTSLTYQSVTAPRTGGNEDLDQRAKDIWAERLQVAGEMASEAQAHLWIEGLRQDNEAYWQDRLGTYRKQARDEAIKSGGALEHLHDSAAENLNLLKQAGVGLVILDECHHLLGHWGRVLAEAHDLLDAPIVVGLTATPPDTDGVDADDAERYRTFFGPVDIEIPVPALVKDGLLAPYQDLVYFARPVPRELPSGKVSSWRESKKTGSRPGGGRTYLPGRARLCTAPRNPIPRHTHTAA